MLTLQEDLYKNGEKHLSGFDMIKLLTPLKKQPEYSWLNKVSNTSLQIVCRDLDGSYQGFFNKIKGHPKFKSRKKAKPSYPARAERMYFTETTIQIEKVGKVKYKTDLNIPLGKGNKFTNPRITYVLGKWILSFGIECENQAPDLTEKSMGIDLGVKEQAVVAFGDEQIIFHNINKSRKVRKLKQQIKHRQRSISRKYEASKKRTGRYEKTANIEKEEAKLRKQYYRLANIRSDYIHQITHKLVSYRPKRVVMEDLNVQGMMKNRHLSKAIGEQNFYEFIRQMKYKCEWNGIEFV